MELVFDENNYEEVRSALSVLVRLRKKLEAQNPKLRVSNARFEKQMASFEKEYKIIQGIYKADVSFVYEQLSTDNTNNFYVYVHCNPLKPLNVKKSAKQLFAGIDLCLTSTPFYVGKGTDERCFDLNRNEGHRKIKQMIQSVSKNIEVVKIAEDLTEQQALALESKLIDIFGLKQLHEENLLVNLNEGINSDARRNLYPKGSNWFLNRTKMRLYNSVPCKNG